MDDSYQMGLYILAHLVGAYTYSLDKIGSVILYANSYQAESCNRDYHSYLLSGILQTFYSELHFRESHLHTYTLKLSLI